MIVKKVITETTTQDKEIEIKGATLLSLEQVKALPIELRQYDWSWWLYSPGINQNDSVYMHWDVDSIFEATHRVGTLYTCIRPALFINFKSSNFQIGDVFIFANKKFVIVSEKLAFCKTDIGRSYYKDDDSVENASNYETSDIKKYIDNWFLRIKK